MLIIPALRKLRQEVYHEFQSNLGYTMRLSIKNKQPNKQKEKIKGVRVGYVVWWSGTCLACSRPWVHTSF